MHRLTHPSILAAASAGVILALASTITTLPAPLWAIWVGFTIVGVVQAVRA